MRWAVILGVMALLSGRAAAFDIDYDAVMAAHAEQVVDRGDGSRVLNLPGPVQIIETGDGADGRRFWAEDASPAGSAGCMFSVLVEISAAARLCTGMLSEAESARLAAALTRSAEFVAANTVPRVPQGDIAARLGALVDAAEARYRKAMACPGDPGGDPIAAALARQAASPEFADIQTAMHAQPRLPVPKPCF